MAICLNALHPMGMQFADKITMLLDRRGWTQRELSRRAKVSHTTVGNWINDGRLPDIEVAARLARVLDVPLEYLADADQDQPPTRVGADELALLDVMRSRGITPADVLKLLVPNQGAESLSPGMRDAEPKHRRA